MNPKHQTFVNELLCHGDKVKAYQTVYPKATPEAARVAATRLLSRPPIAAQLAQANQQAHQSAVLTLTEHITEEVQQQYATIAQKRGILAKMINGEWRTKRYINLRNKVELVMEDLSPYALLRAIELDTKLAIEQERLLAIEQKDEQATAAEPGRTGEMSDEDYARSTIPFPKYGDKEAMRFWCNYHYGEGHYEQLMATQADTQKRFAPAKPQPVEVAQEQPAISIEDWERQCAEEVAEAPEPKPAKQDAWQAYLRSDPNLTNLPQAALADKKQWFSLLSPARQQRLIQLNGSAGRL